MKGKIKSILLASGALLFAVCLLTMPTETVEASKRGLDIWASSVFPSLLPFFVTGELLIGFGVVHFIGVLFEPIMRPLFNVPGVGGFAWAIGMASGYPAGANFTARMRQEGQISKVEAERLIAFTRYHTYLYGRFIQAGLAAMLILCLSPLIHLKNDSPIRQAIPVQSPVTDDLWRLIIQFLNHYGMLITIASLAVCFIILLYRLIKQYKGK